MNGHVTTRAYKLMMKSLRDGFLLFCQVVLEAAIIEYEQTTQDNDK